MKVLGCEVVMGLPGCPPFFISPDYGDGGINLHLLTDPPRVVHLTSERVAGIVREALEQP